MPPGWDGVETAARIWEVDAEISIVICSAYSDYSWHEVVRRLNRPALRLLQKPFETSEVLELAWSLTSKRLRRSVGPRTP
jgi:FixJ family two-component response regulator